MKQGHNGRLPQKTSKASPLYERIAGLISQARQTVIRNTNSVMVYTYYEIGRMIVEDEQKGSKKAEYGEQVLEALAQKLTEAFGKGFSVTNLRQMRSFYLVYGAGQIRQTLSDEFKKRFKLSWSHYVKLMRIDENKTIGIVLCRSKNEALVEITLPEHNKTIFASQYKTVLPSKAALKKLLAGKDGIT
jgi:predicted ATP-binding protein involved in virulence